MLTDPLFRMTVDGIFTIKGHGIALTGTVESGVLKVGDEVYAKSVSGIRKLVVADFKMFGTITEARAGDNIGILFRDIEAGEIKQGDVLVGNDKDHSLSA